MILLRFAPVFLFLLGFASLARSESPYQWKAGFSSADITPEELGWMAGYAARKGPAEKVLQPLFAKVLVVEDESGNQVVIVTMDLIGVPRDFRDEIAAQLQKGHSIPSEALLINASHTHSGPMIRVYRPPGQEGVEKAPYASIPEEQQELRVEQTKAYLTTLRERILGAVASAIEKKELVDLCWAKSRCGFAMNRRLPAAGGWKNSPNPDAPVDHEVPVLQVISKKENALRGVVFGYACHATVLSLMEISGDWPGYAQEYFENDHPGVTAMFLNGCSGDQNPYPRRMLLYAQRHGRSMATAIEAALESPKVYLSGPLYSGLASPEIPYQESPSREALEAKSRSTDRYEARHGRFLLDVLDSTGTLPRSYPVPVQVVRFGQGPTIAAIGGEVVVDYSIRLKREIGAITNAPVWVAGYSNDVMTYIPSKRVLLEGGYEGGGAMRYTRSTVHPALWDESIEERLVAEILRMVSASANQQ